MTVPAAQKGQNVGEISLKSKAKTQRFYMDGQVYDWKINCKMCTSMFVLIPNHEV